MCEDSVKQRLTSYLKYKRVSKSEFGRTIGVSNSFITSMRKSLQPDKIKSIAMNYPDLNTDWLITGEGEMLRPSVVQNNQSGDNINGNSVNISKSETEKLLEVINSFNEIIRKKDEQINRLLTIIENNK